jgi:hypothetical protein
LRRAQPVPGGSQRETDQEPGDRDREQLAAQRRDAAVEQACDHERRPDGMQIDRRENQPPAENSYARAAEQEIPSAREQSEHQ